MGNTGAMVKEAEGTAAEYLDGGAGDVRPENTM